MDRKVPLKRLSVIIYQAEPHQDLQPTIQALTEQMQPADDYEIIIASRNDMALPAQNIPTSWGVKVTSCPDASLSRIIEIAQGTCCLFLQGDCKPLPGLIASHLNRLEGQSQEMIASLGIIQHVAPPEAPWFVPLWCQLQNERMTALIDHPRRIALPDLPLGNLAVRREHLSSISISDDCPQSREIFELIILLKQQGVRLLPNPAARVIQVEGRGLDAIRQDSMERGAAGAALWQRHPQWLPGLFRVFYDSTPRAVFLRRLLLHIGAPARLFQWVKLLPDQSPLKYEGFRFFEAYGYWQGVQQTLGDNKLFFRLISGSPHLMYHAFGKENEPASHYIVPVSRFARQMALLKLLNYRVISLEEYVRCLREGRLPPERSVIITIDDGYADNYQLAFPILARYHFPATIFLISNFMARENTWDKGSPLYGRPLLTWDEARVMQDAGISFGAHTCSHPYLPELLPEQVSGEVLRSKQQIEQALGKPVRLFAYPHGSYNQECEQIVEEAGFWAACSVDPGQNTPGGDLFALLRMDIRGTDSLFRFLFSIWFGK